jgi:release factor glutamine methyltransferase
MHEVIFSGLSLDASPGRVMMPRPATEQLVAAAVDFVGPRPARVADVGTGTGAIALAIAQAVPDARVYATDTSPHAVELASANVQRHGLGDRVTVRRGDLLDPVPGPIDLVVANLPYLPAGEATLYPDLAGEPVSAVFAPGDGLEPYRRLLAACAERLDDAGAVIIQLHRSMLQASAAELPKLQASLDYELAA